MSGRSSREASRGERRGRLDGDGRWPRCPASSPPADAGDRRRRRRAGRRGAGASATSSGGSARGRGLAAPLGRRRRSRPAFRPSAARDTGPGAGRARPRTAAGRSQASSPRRPAAPGPSAAAPARDRLLEAAGALGLAGAGAIVTVLGIVFFFVLAVNRGWINAELRLGFGAAASLGVFAAGFWLKRRYGTTYAALAAVGAGIAGGFATLLAASALYGFVPSLGARGRRRHRRGRDGVASRGRAELVAALGLVGAHARPAHDLVEDEELTLVGTSFVAVLLAATAVVALRQRWRGLLVPGCSWLFPADHRARRPERADGLGRRLADGDLLGPARRGRDRRAARQGRPADRLVRSDADAGRGGVGSRLLGTPVRRRGRGREPRGHRPRGVALAYLALGAAFFHRIRDFSSAPLGRRPDRRRGRGRGAPERGVARGRLGRRGGGPRLARGHDAGAAVPARLARIPRARRSRTRSGTTRRCSELFERAPSIRRSASQAWSPSRSAAGLVAWLCTRPPERGEDEGPIGPSSPTSSTAHPGRARRPRLGGGRARRLRGIVRAVELFGLASRDERQGFERGQVAVSALLGARRGSRSSRPAAGCARLELSVAGLRLTGLAVLKTGDVRLRGAGSSTTGRSHSCWSAPATLLAGFEYQRLDVGRWKQSPARGGRRGPGGRR